MTAIRPHHRRFEAVAEHNKGDSNGRSSSGQGAAFGDLHALREENRQLRELVIQLSRLVIRNVVDHK